MTADTPGESFGERVAFRVFAIHIFLAARLQCKIVHFSFGTGLHAELFQQ